MNIKNNKMPAKNLFQIFILIIISISILACTNSSNNSGDVNMDEEYRKGTQGLEMKFLPELPPTSVFDTYPLSVMVEYRNAGASTIDNGIIYLSGYDSRYVNLQSTSSGDNRWVIGGLDGKSTFNPKGLYSEIAEFTTYSVDVDPIPGVDSFGQTIKATACYEYVTGAFPLICVDPTLGRGTVTEKVCTVHPVSLSGGQGAPVSITKVDQEMAAGQSGTSKVIFKIAVKNEGRGTPFNVQRGIENCHSELSYADVDIVNLDSVSFSGNNLQCQPSQLRLTGGQGFAICSYEGSFGEDAFETPLSITLRYGYRDSIQTSVRIVNIS